MTSESDVKTYIILGLLAALGGTGGSIVTTKINDPRPDPFTGQDGKALARTITKDVKEFVAAANELTKRELDLKIREIESQLPPPATKQRVRAIEIYLESKDSEFSPPTYDWQ